MKWKFVDRIEDHSTNGRFKYTKGVIYTYAGTTILCTKDADNLFGTCIGEINPCAQERLGKQQSWGPAEWETLKKAIILQN